MLSSWCLLPTVMLPSVTTRKCHTKWMPREGSKKMGFIPIEILECLYLFPIVIDKVPHWEGLSLNSRIEILMEEEFGSPYVILYNTTGRLCC
mmetsp:Transcript_32987/g.69422  ORF Transcript_32987/g.69422 Transcript_32987/m.69422 type:complete len:92 (+) Transcript_32987:92-367(+)